MKAILRTIGTVIGVPTVIAIVYFGFIASDVYVSETRFTVRSANNAVSVGGLGALLTTSGIAGGPQDSLMVADFARSHDMLDRLDESLGLVRHYAAPEIDRLSRLDEDATRDERLDYYRRHVRIQRDLASDVITLQARAFSPAMSRRIAGEIIDISERFVNDLSVRIEEDALSSARGEMERAVQRVRSTAQDINRFQSANNSVSPEDESVALFARVASLESRLTETRAQLGEARAYMREDTADVVALKNRVNALERQLALEKGRAIGDEDGAGRLGSMLATFSPLMLEREIAQQQYTSALASYEAARLDAARKKQYLITIVEPNLPDAPSEPRRLVKILTVMIFSFLAYLIGGLLWSALKDHMGR